MMVKLIGAAVGAVLVAQSVSVAHAAPVTPETYTLTLSGGFSGTGTLAFSDGPVPSTGDFTVNLSDLTTLTITIGQNVFNLAPATSAVVFRNGALYDITAGWVTVNGEELEAINITGAPDAFVYTPANGQQLTATISAQLQTTPLPAALPLFAGGLGVFGFLSRRKKKIAANLATA